MVLVHGRIAFLFLVLSALGAVGCSPKYEVSFSLPNTINAPVGQNVLSMNLDTVKINHDVIYQDGNHALVNYHFPTLIERDNAVALTNVCRVLGFGLKSNLTLRALGIATNIEAFTTAGAMIGNVLPILTQLPSYELTAIESPEAECRIAPPDTVDGAVLVNSEYGVIDIYDYADDYGKQWTAFEMRRWASEVKGTRAFITTENGTRLLRPVYNNKITPQLEGHFFFVSVPKELAPNCPYGGMIHEFSGKGYWTSSGLPRLRTGQSYGAGAPGVVYTSAPTITCY